MIVRHDVEKEDQKFHCNEHSKEFPTNFGVSEYQVSAPVLEPETFGKARLSLRKHWLGSVI